MPQAISHDDAEREFQQLVSASKVRLLTDEEVEQFASLLGKFVLLSTSHPGAVAFLEREDVKRSIWDVGLMVNGRV